VIPSTCLRTLGMVLVVACFEYQRWIGNNSSRLNLAKFESHINSSDAVIDSPAVNAASLPKWTPDSTSLASPANQYAPLRQARLRQSSFQIEPPVLFGVVAAFDLSPARGTGRQLHSTISTSYQPTAGMRPRFATVSGRRGCSCTAGVERFRPVQLRGVAHCARGQG
jgi:hypothetical protein